MASNPLRTPLCDRLETDVPILLAGMGGIDLSELAAAVSEAKGLGFIGGVGLSKGRLSQEIERAKGLTKRSLGVDLLVPQPASEEEVKRMAGSRFEAGRCLGAAWARSISAPSRRAST